MNETERKIVGDAAEEILVSMIAGVPVKSGTVSRTIRDPGEIAGNNAFAMAYKAGVSRLVAGSIADMTYDLVTRCCTDIRKTKARGGKPIGVKRTSPDSVEIEFEGGRRAGVPSSTKSEMAEMARTGFTAAEIGEEYGYPEPDVHRILKSMKVQAAESRVETRPEQREIRRELGLTGIDATTELTVAEALMKGASVEEVSASTGVPVNQVKAVKTAWADTSVPEAAAEVVAYRRDKKAKSQPSETDPTTAGEILFYKGAGSDGWRVEIAPMLADRFEKDLDVLRSMMVHGSSVTEYDVVYTNIRRFADRNMPASTRRLKILSWRGVRIREFKGFQGRVFFGTMKSVYPGGREVWRCGLVWCLVKKRDDLTNNDLEKVVESLEVWHTWRTRQDAKIAETMQ